MTGLTLIATVATAALAACSIQATDVPFPDSDELIARIEGQVVMPQGAGRLDGYTRTYSRHDPSGGPGRPGTVYGVIERLSDAPRTATWSEWPVTAPADGGCAVVTLRYSVTRDRIEEIRCNGEA